MGDFVEKRIAFPFEKIPETGVILEVADNVFWARMPLPWVLDHVNVYILEGLDGLTIIDTGLNSEVCKSAWTNIFENHFHGKPVKRLLVTHHHPDHVGLVGWFVKEFDVELMMSRSAYLMARMLTLDHQEKPSKETIRFWKRAGMDTRILKARLNERPFNFSDSVAPIPSGFMSLIQGEELNLGGKRWRVEFGQGHAPDHITLWGVDDSIVIAGDQIIPSISSNLGVYATEPFADTVGGWISTCKRFYELAIHDYLVLPGHKLPFHGLRLRVSQLLENHYSALSRVEDKLSEGNYSVSDLLCTIFGRKINADEYGLALAEAIGHVNYFRRRGRLSWEERSDGALLYSISKTKSF